MSLAEDPYHRFRLRIQELLDRADELLDEIDKRDRTIERRDRTIQKLYGRNYWFKHGRDLWRHRAKQQSNDSRYLRQFSRSMNRNPKEANPLSEVTQPGTAEPEPAEPDDDDGPDEDSGDGGHEDA